MCRVTLPRMPGQQSPQVWGALPDHLTVRDQGRRESRARAWMSLLTSPVQRYSRL